MKSIVPISFKYHNDRIAASMRELLWRFYERQKQYVKAAKTLLALAEETG